MKAGDRWGGGIPYRNNRRFGNAIQAHGWESFDSYILAFAEDRETLNIAEIQAIVAAGVTNQNSLTTSRQVVTRLLKMTNQSLAFISPRVKQFSSKVAQMLPAPLNWAALISR